MDTIEMRNVAAADKPEPQTLREAINTSLHNRDAVICAILNPGMKDAEWDALTMTPHSPTARSIMQRIIVNALRQPERLDVPRIQRFASCLAHAGREHHEPQTLATAAYLHLLSRNMPEAVTAAFEALSLDETTSLATLVLETLHRGILRL